jgi:hypothetical protein
VNDVIKFRSGVPLYGPPADFDSFYYTPGSQLLTYGLAKLAGAATSVPAYRVVQLLYTLAATLITSEAARGCRHSPASRGGRSRDVVGRARDGVDVSRRR